MVNKRFLQTAERWKNQTLPKERTRTEKPSRDIGTQVLDYSFLGGEIGKKAHEEIVRKYGGDHPFVTQNVFYDEESELIKGSKPGYIIVLNEFLLRGMRTSTSFDLQKAMDEEKITQRGTYEDLGIVLFSESGENEYLAKDLARQVKDRQELKFPTLIHLTGLELRVDENAPNGMAFKLGENSEIIYAPNLSHSNHGKKFSGLDESGVPIFEDNGSYTFYTGNSGMRVLIRNWDSDLIAGDGVLVYSNAGGRVLVSREAARSKSGGTR